MRGSVGAGGFLGRDSIHWIAGESAFVYLRMFLE